MSGTKHTRRNWLIAAGLCIVALYATGFLDKPLSSVGLNTEPCAERLIGGKLCGAELVAFCRESYDPEINEDTCGQVLRDEGVDTAALAREREEAEREEIARVEREFEEEEKRKAAEAEKAARREGKLERPSAIEGITFTVERIGPSASVEGSYSTLSPAKGKQFVVAPLEYKNTGDGPLDLLCGGSGFRLIDDAGRKFRPDAEAMLEAAANSEACSGGVQPGDAEDAIVIFEVARTVRPVQLVLWNSEQGNPEDGVEHLVIPTAG